MWSWSGWACLCGPFEQCPRALVMFGDQRRQIEADDLAVAHPLPPIDDRQRHRLRLAEDQRGDRVVERAGVGQRIQAPASYVGGLAWLEAADVIAAQHSRP